MSEFSIELTLNITRHVLQIKFLPVYREMANFFSASFQNELSVFSTFVLTSRGKFQRSQVLNHKGQKTEWV